MTFMTKPGGSAVKRARILIVDDAKIWREGLSEILHNAGFEAHAVSSVETAKQALEDGIYHIIILDLRLDDADHANVQGLELLEQLWRGGLTKAMRIMMLTANGTQEYTRQAFRDYDVADFISKDNFNDQVFLENVQRVLNSLQANLTLEIAWQTNSLAQTAVHNMAINGREVNAGTPYGELIAAELEQLLRHLFVNAQSILIRLLKSSPTRSGTRILWVHPFYQAGGGQAVIVKFGQYEQIHQEKEHFYTYVSPFAGARSTTINASARTARLGGLVYSLLGATNHRWTDFAQFYQQSSIEAIQGAIQRLFHDTCGHWYANPGNLMPRNLKDEYIGQFGATLAELEQEARLNLPYVLFQEKSIHFDHLGKQQDFTNPFPIVVDHTFRMAVYACPTHGDMNQYNILVDELGYIWLVDFQNTEHRHILRDVATLDAIVRFQLLPAGDASLDERLEMERALCQIKNYQQLDKLEQSYRPKNPALQKTFATVLHLRRQAHWMTDQNPSDDMSDYFIALLFNALNTLQFSSLDEVQREHALLSASLLIDTLD